MTASPRRDVPHQLAVIFAAVLFSNGTTDAQTEPMAPMASANPPAQDGQRYSISYICGDGRIDGTAPLPADGRPYNLGVSFLAQDGGPLDNVQVRLRRHGRVLVEFNARGPRCLFSVPDASYRIEGTYQGATKDATVDTGALNTQLRW